MGEVEDSNKDFKQSQKVFASLFILMEVRLVAHIHLVGAGTDAAGDEWDEPGGTTCITGKSLRLEQEPIRGRSMTFPQLIISRYTSHACIFFLVHLLQ